MVPFGHCRNKWNALKGMKKKIYFQNICILLMNTAGHVPNNCIHYSPSCVPRTHLGDIPYAFLLSHEKDAPRKLKWL